MTRPPPRSTRTYTLFPYPTLVRSIPGLSGAVCDVADAAALDAVRDDAIARLGGLDIMVNNAGTAGPTAPVEEVSLEDWTACLTVNMTRDRKSKRLNSSH